MNIRMAGADYTGAPLEVRERFALTQAESAAIMKALWENAGAYGLTGCVVFSTCNRTEYWISCDDDAFDGLDLAGLMCSCSGLDAAGYSGYITERRSTDAVRYLMELAAGLHSQIFGDDQILGQVKAAALLARECGTIGHELDVLFRTAVTAAKDIKTQLDPRALDGSAAARLIEVLKEDGVVLSGSRCLVIGNGQIGRLAAAGLCAEGAQVWITLRKHNNRDTVVPAGCRSVDYDDRYSMITRMDIVVSATASPHFTLTAQGLSVMPPDKRLVIADLAVPRDVEPAAGKLAQVTLYNIDSLGSGYSDREQQTAAQASVITDRYAREYEQWYTKRGCVPMINTIAQCIGQQTAARLERDLKKYDLGDDARASLTADVQRAAKKAAARLCFGLQDELELDEYEPCIEALFGTAVKMQGERPYITSPVCGAAEDGHEVSSFY